MIKQNKKIMYFKIMSKRGKKSATIFSPIYQLKVLLQLSSYSH